MKRVLALCSLMLACGVDVAKPEVETKSSAFTFYYGTLSSNAAEYPSHPSYAFTKAWCPHYQFQFYCVYGNDGTLLWTETGSGCSSPPTNVPLGSPQPQCQIFTALQTGIKPPIVEFMEIGIIPIDGGVEYYPLAQVDTTGVVTILGTGDGQCDGINSFDCPVEPGAIIKLDPHHIGYILNNSMTYPCSWPKYCLL